MVQCQRAMGKNTSLCLSCPLYAPIPSPALPALTQSNACLLSQEGLQVPLPLPRGSWPGQTSLCSASWDAVPRASSLSSPSFFFSDALCEKGVSLAPFCVFHLRAGVGVGEPLRGAVLPCQTPSYTHLLHPSFQRQRPSQRMPPLWTSVGQRSQGFLPVTWRLASQGALPPPHQAHTSPCSSGSWWALGPL